MQENGSNLFLSAQSFLLRTLEKAGPALPLRQRYLFTRHNRLRARYIAAGILAVALTGTALSNLAATPGAPAQIAVAEMATPEIQAQAEQASAPVQAMTAVEQKLASIVPPVAPAKPAKPRARQIEVGKGDTLAGVLQKAGIAGNEVYSAITALQKYIDPKAIRPGQKIHLHFKPDGEDGSPDFATLSMSLDPLRTVSLQRHGEGEFKAEIEEKKTRSTTRTAAADIELSLFGSALKAGIPSSVITEAIRIYSWDIDFQRDIRRGDRIEVMYDQKETEDGIVLNASEIIYARLKINGADIPVYRYKLKNGDIDYFTADGKSIRKALMTTPVDGARLSSGFGMRKHPVLGYSKMHKGIDFAAPTGTPIYAAGDGVIEKRGPYSSYGNYISIRHNSGLRTAYAHLSRFNPAVRVGGRVKQGTVIGYIGTTGRSTGPHLHYEVHLNGVQVNPRSVKTPQGEVLKGTELASFKNHMRQIEQRYASLDGRQKLAEAFTGR